MKVTINNSTTYTVNGVKMVEGDVQHIYTNEVVDEVTGKMLKACQGDPLNGFNGTITVENGGPVTYEVTDDVVNYIKERGTLVQSVKRTRETDKNKIANRVFELISNGQVGLTRNGQPKNLTTGNILSGSELNAYREVYNEDVVDTLNNMGEEG